MKISELFDLMDKIKFYSNCDDLRFTYDGNVMAVWLYWLEKEFNVSLQFTGDQIRMRKEFEIEDIEGFIETITACVNQAKHEWSLKYGKPFEEKTDGQGGDGVDLGNIPA